MSVSMPVTRTAVTRKQVALSDHRQTFDELCTWIEAHLQEPIGWQELMAQSGLDHQTLNALFFKFLSTTPMAWIRKRRELSLAPSPTPPAPAHRLLRPAAA
ncbi:MAG: helix-turn-helix transcriptional regulator [Burkholderiales bacterium]|nr:helix-turn-helix transcriptional regulator [Burkholderiales bacterium]